MYCSCLVRRVRRSLRTIRYLVFIAGTWGPWLDWSTCYGPNQYRSRGCISGPKRKCGGPFQGVKPCTTTPSIGKHDHLISNSTFRTFNTRLLHIVPVDIGLIALSEWTFCSRVVWGNKLALDQNSPSENALIRDEALEKYVEVNKLKVFVLTKQNM